MFVGYAPVSRRNGNVFQRAGRFLGERARPAGHRLRGNNPIPQLKSRRSFRFPSAILGPLQIPGKPGETPPPRGRLHGLLQPGRRGPRHLQPVRQVHLPRPLRQGGAAEAGLREIHGHVEDRPHQPAQRRPIPDVHGAQPYQQVRGGRGDGREGGRGQDQRLGGLPQGGSGDLGSAKSGQ